MSHRALMMAAMASGQSRIHGLLESEDVLRTATAVRALGAAVERDGKTIGRIGTVGRSHALAHIRFDRMGDGATVDGVAVAITP